MSTNKRKSYAEEGLEAVQQETGTAEALINTSSPTGYGEGEEGELQQVGGLEPVAFFFRTSAPKKTPKSPFKVLESGQVIEGTFERSFISGKYQNPTYIIRLTDGTLAGLASTGSLKKGMSKLAEGSKVKIVYNGMQVIKSGQWEGSDAHNFIVYGNKLKV